MKIFTILLFVFSIDVQAQFTNFSFITPQKTKRIVETPFIFSDSQNNLGDTFWYNPNKDYYKIFVQAKGVYKVTYDELIRIGVPPNSGIQKGNLELINNGKRIPIEIVDVNKNNSFDSGDYFIFVGLPPQPSTSYTYFNIYNLSNVYWFSYQAESVYNYKKINWSTSTLDNFVTTNLQTIHYEKDSIFERLGYAPDDHRDFWFWANIETRNKLSFETFTNWLADSILYKINPAFPQATIRANLQGISNESCNGFTHSANIKFNSIKVAGQKWSGQNSTTFDGKFSFSFNGLPGVPLFADKNKVEIALDGDICPTDGNDIVKVNWFELDFWRWNSVKGKSYIFISPPDQLGRNTYSLSDWYSNNMQVYIPSRGELICNPIIPNDSAHTILFTDSIGARTEYFCSSLESFMSPDSISKNNSSNLHSISQGADYIIITHPAFMSAAKRLAEFRTDHLAGYSAPRIKIVNVTDIYNEFSYGLQDPYALQSFIKYSFENWQSPAPAFVTLLGDMSFDYRHLFAGSSLCIIPSIPYLAYSYGLAPSDNLIACIEGDDMVPDLAIGRLSCDNLDEANNLVNKIISYPGDPGKNWKDNVLLIAGGRDVDDQLNFGFTDQSEKLNNSFLKPNGISNSRVFGFPDKQDYIKYQGGRSEILNIINKGCIFVNYYGHGGENQWDQLFNNNDIRFLNNGGRLPFISSITSYLSQVDDQDSFGEMFNKLPGKGSIGFFGGIGLTMWSEGLYINNKLFNEIFNKRNNLIGSAILNTKAGMSGSGFVTSHLALLSLLGDPAIEIAIPGITDFQLTPADIKCIPPNPILGETSVIKVYVRNVGTIFNDSVTINLYETQIDSSHKIGSVKLPGFGDLDSVFFKWVPDKAGTRNLFADVNSDNHIEEIDHSDNTTSTIIKVFNFNKPDIVRPLNGYTTSSNKINFTLIDAGSYIGRQFNYRFIIDTSFTLFSSAKIISPDLIPQNGFVKWDINLPVGEYFWKVLIYDDMDTNYNKLTTFSINNISAKGFSAIKKQLDIFGTNGGNFLTTDIGPAKKWNSLSYNVDSINYRGKFNAFILGLNKNSGSYDTIKSRMPSSFSLSDINSKKYEYLKIGFNFTDSSYDTTFVCKLKDLAVDFTSLPEISVNNNNFTLSPDTILQGFNALMKIQIFNLGESDADSVILKYYANNSDSAFLSNKISVPKDSSVLLENFINTSSLSPTFNIARVVASIDEENFTYNNIAEKKFYVVRDSSKPVFNITFDGRVIDNGDVISSKPEIIITLKDNSPLPIDTSSFTIFKLDNIPVGFSRPDLKFSSTPYPNSQATIKWNPLLPDGKHILEIFAEDPSGNYFDSTSHKYEFFVYNQPDIVNVFNYPNPFNNETYFTFELHGQKSPEEFKIKIFTVAGRLIKDITVPPSALRIGFNKLYWDGRDQDGDEIANGAYFYKIIARNNGVVKTLIEKLAKIK
ncbi:MAG: C25 family cysteine peptidase [Ignavibacteriaceae bacterium]|nr:C25 family cysteine peptidase [Ignavibacteriaceae bacterium]